MQPHLLHLRIISPQMIEYEGNVKMVIIPGIEGELGILPHHAPIIVELTEGKIVVHGKSNSEYIDIQGGVASIGNDNRLEILLTNSIAKNI